jgi:hypothetical protein
MRVQTIGATAVALGCGMGRYLDNVKPEVEMVADQQTELQVTWPRNGAGECAAVAELVSEATEFDGQRRRQALAIQAYIGWL